jgi:iron complex outermembrane receptor protein
MAPSMPSLSRPALLGLALAVLTHPVVAQEAVPGYETVVTATTPVHGSGLPREMVPANVQVATAGAIAAAHSPDLTEFVEGNLGSVHLDQVLGNPLQPDLHYRGFAASPVLGAPQGLAVYLDGVRANEPFGDAVNWDLLPVGALRTINLMAGSNPVFGLNTLGGALSLETKDGFSSPGAHGQLSGGSFARRTMSFELGASEGRFGAFVAGNAFLEDGWREASASDAKQAFAVASFLGADASVHLSLLAADTRLEGNGPAPVQLLALSRRTVFTHPDRTGNRLAMPTLRAEQRLGERVRVSGVAYFRASTTDTLNGDQAPDDLSPAGDDAPAANAVLNGTHTRQRGLGATVQVAHEALLLGRQNHLFVGAAADVARVRFGAHSEGARLSETREALPTGLPLPAAQVALDTVTRTYGGYATDTLALRPDLFLTAAGRFNWSRLTLDDRLTDALDGQHRFARFNPAAGLSWQPRPAFGLFGGYSESARAPTPLELACADPEQPCRLPNGFVADPPLAQVVARTVELGVRGRLRRTRVGLDYSVAAFHASTSHDILFVSAGPSTNQGYFDDVGRTRRRGVELGLDGHVTMGPGWALAWSAHYTWLDATFRSAFDAPSPNHPRAVQGSVPVSPGDRLPGVPRHLASAGLAWTFHDRLTLGGTVVFNGGQYLRGDEANLLAPLSSHAVLELRATWQITPVLAIFARVRNVFDARFATFGTLGDARPVLGPTFDDPRFVGPGAPRGGWAGLDLRF